MTGMYLRCNQCGRITHDRGELKHLAHSCHIEEGWTLVTEFEFRMQQAKRKIEHESRIDKEGEGADDRAPSLLR
jgi:hypothetical protein